MFTIYVISLKDKDGLESLNRIKLKIKNKEVLNGEDILLLIAIVFMKSNYNECELLFITAKLTNKAKFESDFIKDQVKAVQLILGDKFIKDNKVLERFKEIVNMESSYFASVFERYGERVRQETKKEYLKEGIGRGRLIGIDEGEVIGIEKKSLSVAHWMLDRNMPVEDISEATGLSIERINALK